MLAGAFQGMQQWLTRHLWRKEGLAAGLICLGTILALLLPLAALTTFIVTQIIQGVNFISNLVQQRGLEGLLASRGATAAQTVGGVVAATGTLVFQAVMMLIALFFLLLDGQRLVTWLESVFPLKRGQTTELLTEFRRVTRSVLVSTLATAGVPPRGCQRI